MHLSPHVILRKTYVKHDTPLFDGILEAAEPSSPDATLRQYRTVWYIIFVLVHKMMNVCAAADADRGWAVNERSALIQSRRSCFDR
jgi:hypothetical protein